MIDSDVKLLLKSHVSGYYEIQHLRIIMGNRLVANFRAKLGIQPSKKESEAKEEAQKLLGDLRKSSKRISDAIAKKTRSKTVSFPGDKLISSMSELVLVTTYSTMLKSEKANFKQMEELVEEFRIWTDHLKDIRGCGATMASCIIAKLDPHKARYPSSFCKYAGLDVGPDGKGRNRSKEHLVETTYTARDGSTKKKMGITYNDWLRSKLIGVLAESFIKQKSDYTAYYYAKKHEMQNDPRCAGMSKGHIDARAKRFMIKNFLADLHTAWRKIEGLPAPPPYHEGIQGHVHSLEQFQKIVEENGLGPKKKEEKKEKKARKRKAA